MAGLVLESVDAEPRFVNSIGVEGDLFQAQCKKLENDEIECEFVQVALPIAAKAADLEEAIARVEREADKQDFAGLKETCALFSHIGVAMDYLDQGRDTLAKEHLKKLPKYDENRGFEKFKAMGRSARRDVMVMVRAFGRFCSDPSTETFVDITIIEHQKKMRTCEPRITTWTDRFTPVSDKVWSLNSNEPNGVCGVVRLDRFECEDSRFFCNYIAEKRILNKHGNLLGLGEGSCSNLDEAAYEYRWDSTELYLNCEILDL